MDDNAGRLAALQALQVLQERFGIGITGAGVLGEGLFYNPANALAQGRVKLLQRRGRFMGVQVTQGQGAIHLEWRPAGQQVKEGTPQGIHVGAWVHRVAGPLFWRSVQRRPHGRTRLGNVQGF